MKTTFIGVILVVGVVGVFGGYLAPGSRVQRGHQGGGRGGYSGGGGGGGFGQGGGNGGSGSGPGAVEVTRFVTIHAPPNDFDEPKKFSGGPRVVYEKGPRDKNYNIIFVRAPTPPPHPRTEVVLPKPNSQKTLVYVLHQSPNGSGQNIKFKYPKPTKPTKPEVFFVPFTTDKKGGSQGQGGQSGGGGGTGSGGYA